MALRLCKVCGDFHDLDRAWPHNCLPEVNLAASDLPRPMIISDNLDYVWNPVDGKHYSSKKKYYGEVKARGFEIAGNDSSVRQAHTAKRKHKAIGGLKDDLKRAWDQHGG